MESRLQWPKGRQNCQDTLLWEWDISSIGLHHPKTKMDTQNDGLEKVAALSLWPFFGIYVKLLGFEFILNISWMGFPKREDP